MDTEWEATFWPINKDEVRERFKRAGAELSYEERFTKRYVLHLP